MTKRTGIIKEYKKSGISRNGNPYDVYTVGIAGKRGVYFTTLYDFYEMEFEEGEEVYLYYNRPYWQIDIKYYFFDSDPPEEKERHENEEQWENWHE